MFNSNKHNNIHAQKKRKQYKQYLFNRLYIPYDYVHNKRSKFNLTRFSEIYFNLIFFSCK